MRVVHEVLLISLFSSLCASHSEFLTCMKYSKAPDSSQTQLLLKAPLEPQKTVSHPFSSILLSIFLYLFIQETFTEHVFCSMHYLKNDLQNFTI